MAEDPNRDFLSIRDSCADTSRSSTVDPRERHVVCKLDRYELEDRYLRLLEEANNLKKLSNCQEDKIKRLATKLMRASSNPRPCSIALDLYDDKNKITALELENSKLKDKIGVLRNQLLSHTISGRSTSRARNPQVRPSSGRITCRSESGRPKVPLCHCISVPQNNRKETQNYLVRIEELERERKEMVYRIAQLEKELSEYSASSQREKAAENVEYIKVWRQVKQLNDKLIAAQEANDTLNAQINELKKILKETTKNNQEISAALITEKKRLAEFDEQLIRAKDSELSLREKDEQIRDLANELKILQQHNNELLTLSSKYGQVEMENMELKKRISETLQDQLSLKSAVSAEQANNSVLQATNGQLLQKVQELQKDIDSLQLQSLASQNEREIQEPVSRKRSEGKQLKKMQKEACYPQQGSNSETKCDYTCNSCEDVTAVEKAVNTMEESLKIFDKSVQTEKGHASTASIFKDQGTSMVASVAILTQEKETKSEEKITEESSSQTLTPEKMLKYLDQAQISTSLEAARIGRKEVYGAEGNQKHSEADTALKIPEDYVERVKEERLPQVAGNSENIINTSPTDTNKVLVSLVKLLREGTLNPKESSGKVESSRKRTMAKTPETSVKRHRVINQRCTENVNTQNSTTNSSGNSTRKNCTNKRHCTGVYAKVRNEKLMSKNSDIKIQNLRSKAVTGDCTCTENTRCYPNNECGYRCCSNCSTISISRLKDNAEDSIPLFIKEPGPEFRDSSQQKVTEGTSSSKQDYTASYKKREPLSVERNFIQADPKLRVYVKQLEQCQKFLYNSVSTHLTGSNGVNVGQPYKPDYKFTIPRMFEVQQTLSTCSLDCPNECPDSSTPLSGTFPLLITDNQGLLELHIGQLQLSTSSKQILFREGEFYNTSLFVCWEIWDQETACTPTLKCPKLNYDSSFVYRIPELSTFFNFVLSEYLILQVVVVKPGNEDYVVARAKLCIKDILDYPQNKLHYIATMNSVIPCSLGMNFGQLSLWVRLSCDVQKVDAFKKHRGLHGKSEPVEMKNTHLVNIHKQERESVETPEKELQVLKEQVPELSPMYGISSESLTVLSAMAPSIPEASDLNVFSTLKNNEEENYERNVADAILKIHRTPSITGVTNNGKEFSEEIGEKRPAHRDVTFKPSKREEADAKGRTSPELDRAFREEAIQADTPSIIEFNALLQCPLEKDTILIEIVDLVLFQKSAVMNDDEVTMLYVEYAFLGYRGASMETESVVKPKTGDQKMMYNFRKKFRVDEDSHTLQRNTLKAMLDESINPNIRFTITSEPPPEDTETKECEEVGYANFNIREYALGNGHKIISLPVMDQDLTDQIGVLKIFVLGVDVLRQCIAENEDDL